MQLLVSSIGLVAALSSCVASAPVSPPPSVVRAATREEVAVVEAALADPRLVAAWGMSGAPVVIDRTEYDRPDDPSPDNGFYCFSQSKTLCIPSALPALLDTEGRATLSLRSLRVPRGFVLASSSWFEGLFQRGPELGWQRFADRYRRTERVLFFSAPVIRNDQALVAVRRWPAAPCCGDGHTIYLEKGQAGWAVVAYGHFWCS